MFFFDAEKTAKQLGLARSQLYVQAIREFIENHNKDRITEKLDQYYDSEKIIDDDVFLKSSLHNLRKAAENDTW